MGIHSFDTTWEFMLVVQEKNRLVLELRSSEKTRKRYPFEFCLRVIFALEGSAVGIFYHVENLSREGMPFGIDGHPGFGCLWKMERASRTTDLNSSSAASLIGWASPRISTSTAMMKPFHWKTVGSSS